MHKSLTEVSFHSHIVVADCEISAFGSLVKIYDRMLHTPNLKFENHFVWSVNQWHVRNCVLVHTQKGPFFGQHWRVVALCQCLIR